MDLNLRGILKGKTGRERDKSNEESCVREKKCKKNNKFNIDIKNIDTYLPPCIWILQNKLKTNLHLKFDERTLYTQIIKSIGFNQNDIITFWDPIFLQSDPNHQKNLKNNLRDIEDIFKKPDIIGYGCKKIITKQLCPFGSSNRINKLSCLLSGRGMTGWS